MNIGPFGMLVELCPDEAAAWHNFELFLARVFHQPLDQGRRDAVTAQCRGYQGVIRNNGVTRKP